MTGLARREASHPWLDAGGVPGTSPEKRLTKNGSMIPYMCIFQRLEIKFYLPPRAERLRAKPAGAGS
jgi:hypothetical protein